MDRTRFIEHRGVRILHLDYAGARDPAEALDAIRHSMDVVAQHPPKSLLVMTSVRDARYNAAVLQAMKELAAHNEPYVKASAVVGMAGLHRIAYQAVILFSRRKIQIFDDETAALDWLVQQNAA
jgi:ABC-type dipeptide/oligopeptide/nickel transport system ATPase subunit